MKPEFTIYDLSFVHRQSRQGALVKSPFASKSNCFTTFFVLPIFGILLAGSFFATAQSTNDSSTTDFSSFQVIVDRNIFNPDRYGRTSYAPSSHAVPTFSLAGTMSYRKGMFAFFNGTSDEYRKALQQGGTIAGYTVTKITFDAVQLQSSGKTIDMKVGAAMRREGDTWVLRPPGEWGDLSASGTSPTNGAAAETSGNLPSGGEQNDVLKRLMEKREQELK